MHLLISEFTFANAKIPGFTEFTGNMVIVKAQKHVPSEFCALEKLVNQLENLLKHFYFFRYQLGKDSMMQLLIQIFLL